MGKGVLFGGGKPPKSASLMGNDEQHETYKLEQKERFYASRRRGGEEEEEEKTRARKRITKSIKRGAFTGLTLKGGVNVFAVLSRYLRGKTTREQLKAREAFEDAVKFSVFVGSFAGAYVTSDEVLAWKFGAEKTKRYRAFVSGVVASPSFLLAGAKPNYSLASYLSLKALVLMSRVGAKSENERVRSLFRVANWEHADVAVVTGSAVVILGCFILKPEAVRGAYGAFLDRHCGKTKRQVEALRELCFLPENDPEGKGEEMFREYCERTAIVLNKTGSLSAAKKDEMLRAIQRGGERRRSKTPVLERRRVQEVFHERCESNRAFSRVRKKLVGNLFHQPRSDLRLPCDSLTPRETVERSQVARQTFRRHRAVVVVLNRVLRIGLARSGRARPFDEKSHANDLSLWRPTRWCGDVHRKKIPPR